ncbi:UNVERIFIED_CONTAM: Phosphoinositide phosphatase SAC3 [Sesamum calycinum]|uniref:Phosphoinositide phosphatase SAC3 n=1 Tax=Sesamum calycinum TaxID=2727403 RepID=A0AAW2P8V6_9LAMI
MRHPRTTLSAGEFGKAATWESGVCISYLGVVHEDSTVVRLHIAIFPGSWHSERYEKLLCMVDLTKDFYFSYSYNVMRSLQKNMCDKDIGLALYETMFVWNEFLTRGIRNILQNTIWTVALVCGFFNQGRVANDVEMEQILAEDVPEGLLMQISSVVQNRGSIPLFWSQETSRLNLKPDIILSKRDHTYVTTRLHFENLVKRYGNPIIILNLIKAVTSKYTEVCRLLLEASGNSFCDILSVTPGPFLEP